MNLGRILNQTGIRPDRQTKIAQYLHDPVRQGSQVPLLVMRGLDTGQRNLRAGDSFQQASRGWATRATVRLTGIQSRQFGVVLRQSDPGLGFDEAHKLGSQGQQPAQPDDLVIPMHKHGAEPQRTVFEQMKIPFPTLVHAILLHDPRQRHLRICDIRGIYPPQHANNVQRTLSVYATTVCVA